MWRNLLLVAASLVAGLAALEAVCRAFVSLPGPYPNSPELVVADARGFWILKPGFDGTMDNRVDFRDRKVTAGPDGGRAVACREEAGGARRIVLIGDSQTFGQGLSDDETWASRLQCRLRAAGRDARVHNLDVPGINADSYVVRLRQVVPALRADDRVVVAVTWNDLHTFHAGAVIESARRGLGEIGSMTDPDAMAAQPEIPYRYLRQPTWRYRLYRRTGFFMPSFDGFKAFADTMSYASALFGATYPRVKELVYRFRPPDALFRKLPDGTFAHNFRLLALMREAVEKTGAAFDAILLPNRVFFDRTYYDAYSQGGRVFPEQDFPGYLARQHCPANGLRCTSMFPYLKTETRDAHTFASDGHYNAAGAQRIAEGVFRRLTGDEGRR